MKSRICTLNGELIMKYAIFLIIVITSAVSGCASTTSAQSGTDNVKITKGPISSSCKLKGQVSVTSDVSSMSTSRHSQVLGDQYGNLRGQARKLGANTVLLSPSSGMTDKKHWATKTTHSEEAAHDYAGKAYWCPAG
jgi:hypothetical protein